MAVSCGSCGGADVTIEADRFTCLTCGSHTYIDGTVTQDATYEVDNTIAGGEMSTTEPEAPPEEETESEETTEEESDG